MSFAVLSIDQKRKKGLRDEMLIFDVKGKKKTKLRDIFENFKNIQKYYIKILKVKFFIYIDFGKEKQCNFMCSSINYDLYRIRKASSYYIFLS